MPMSHILACDACGAQWRWLQMTTAEKMPGCPNPNCGGRAEKELAAPGINRGARPQTSFDVPQTRAGREKFAYQMAEGMGFTNMKDNLREGEVAAPPAPAPSFTADNGRTVKLDSNGFSSVPAEAIPGAISAALGNGVGARVNAPAIKVLGAMKGR